MNNNFDLVVSACSDLLQNFDAATQCQEYINKRLSKQMQDKFGFGYFPTHNNLGPLENVVNENILAELNLIYDKMRDNRKDRYGTLEQHNLIMPYRDLYGTIIALVGRSILSEEERKISGISKYKNTTFDKGKNLFGLYEGRKAILKKGYCVVVEGQFDCIKAHEAGMENIVALGSSNMTFIQLALICRYTNKIVLILDNDEAGRMGADKIMRYYGKCADIRNVVVPEGYKDLCEFFDGGGEVGDLNLKI